MTKNTETKNTEFVGISPEFLAKAIETRQFKERQKKYPCSYCGGKLSIDLEEYLICEDCGGV